MLKYIKWLLVLLVVLLAFGEIAARWYGIGDFPVYDVCADYGYIPKPNQSGTFLRHNRWIFNERSMATGPYRPHQKTDVLLVGDSVVIGGNPLDQADRLGSRLEIESGNKWAVWPVGGASWAALNEMAWMDNNADVVSDCKWVIWSINSGDFYEFSHWVNDDMQPRTRPVSSLYYAWKKYIWDPRIVPQWQHWLKREEDFPAYPAQMMATFPVVREYLPVEAQGKFKGKLLIMLYPAKPELDHQASGWLVLGKMMADLTASSHVAMVNISDEPTWNAGCYRDFIHPNPEGNRVLAKILYQKIQSLEQQP